MQNTIFRAHKEEIIPQFAATIYQYINSLANHQNLKLLKRFDMFIDIKTQQNTICLNLLLRLSSAPLNRIQERKIGMIS